MNPNDRIRKPSDSSFFRRLSEHPISQDETRCNPPSSLRPTAPPTKNESGLRSIANHPSYLTHLPLKLRNAVHAIAELVDGLAARTSPNREFGDFWPRGDISIPLHGTRLPNPNPEPPGPKWPDDDNSILDIDISRFSKELKRTLSGYAPFAGCAYVIARDGYFKIGDALNYSRNVSQKMTIHQPIALASVSKLITGVAVMYALETSSAWPGGISLDSRISDFFPSTWPRSSQFEEISVQNCLQYRVGITQEAGHDWWIEPTIQWVTKGQYSWKDENGVLKSYAIGKDFAVGETANYNNACFAWFRIALFYMTVPKDLRLAMDVISVLSFKTWHTLVSTYYRDFVRSTVLPLGLKADVTPLFSPWTSGTQTLYYHFPYSQKDAGYSIASNLLTAGGTGWFMSAYELARFFAFLRYGKILSKEHLAYLFSFGDVHPSFGKTFIFDEFKSDTPLGPFFAKGGALNGVATYVFQFPRGVQLSILSNADLKNNFRYSPDFTVPVNPLWKCVSESYSNSIVYNEL